jgi:pimeloyl-ACP methyl ester carboxylesterase
LRVKNRLRFAGDVLGQQAHAVAADAKVVVLKNTGHWVLEENPKETTDALMSFL